MRRFFLLVLFFLIPFHVKAVDFGTSLSGTTTIQAGSAFHIIGKVENGDNITAIITKLSYDTTKIKLVSSTGLNQFSILVGSNILADNLEGKSGTFGFVDFTFQALSTFKEGEKTTISLSNVSGSNGVEDVGGLGSSIEIAVINPKSSNANLSSLMMDGKSVEHFNPLQTNYTITVEYDTSLIELSAKTEDGKSTVRGLGTKTLNQKESTYSIVVTAEDGKTKTYTIQVTKRDQKPVVVENAVPSSPKEEEIPTKEVVTKVTSQKDDTSGLWFYLAMGEAVIILITIVILIILSYDYKKIRNILDN